MRLTGASVSVNRLVDDPDRRIELSIDDIDRWGIGAEEFVAGEDEFRIKAVAGRFIDHVPAEKSLQSVIVVVVCSEFSGSTIRRDFALLVHHDELRSFPRLSGFANPAPHFVVLLIHAPTKKMISRGLASDRRIHSDAGGIRRGWGGLTCRQEEGAK